MNNRVYLSKDEYAEYLMSDEWHGRRTKRIEIDNGVCRFCGSKQNLQVHHKTYERLGNEDVEFDLITLCEECHMLWHETIKCLLPGADAIRKEYMQKAGEALRVVSEEYTQMAGHYVGQAAFGVEQLTGGNSKASATITSMMAEALNLPGASCIQVRAQGMGQVYTVAQKHAAKLRRNKKKKEEQK